MAKLPTTALGGGADKAGGTVVTGGMSPIAKPAPPSKGTRSNTIMGGPPEDPNKLGTTATTATTATTITPPPIKTKAPGAAWTWDGNQWVKPSISPKPGVTYTWDDDNGWVEGTSKNDSKYTGNSNNSDPGGVNQGSTGTPLGSAPTERTLALDTFKNTFAVIFGVSEASQPYVSALYKFVSGYYKSGSTIDESLNLSLQQAMNDNAIPEFTDRFKGLFALKAKALTGQAVQVPTIAEFIAAENGMGDVLRSAGMGSLATQDYMGQIIGQGKSVHDVAVAINTSFAAIDGAPQAVKDTLSSQFPMLDRTTLAKSLLMGSDGAAEVQKKIDMATTVTAGKQQGVNLTDAQMGMLSTSGLSYNQQMQGLGNVNLEGTRGQTLTDIYGKAVSGFGQEQAIQDQFQGLASAQRAKQQLIQREQGTFNGSSGTLGPSYGTPRSSFNNLTPGQI